MLQNYLTSTLQYRGCLQVMIFMGDGVPAYIAIKAQQLSRQTLIDTRVISESFRAA